MSSAELIYYVAQSLDGYITDSKERVDWLDHFASENEDYGYNSFYSDIDSLVMGSNTYKFIERYGEWPYSGKPSWVLSQSSLGKMDSLIQISSQSPQAVLNQIQEQGYRKTWLVGGANLAKSFLAINAITGYIVTIMPVILGNGLPLMADLKQMENLEMTNRKIYPSGIVQLSFKPGD